MTRLSFAPVSPDLALDTLHVMALAMRADGKIEPGERKALDAAARALGLGSMGMPGERPNAFRLDRAKEERGLLLAAAIWMVLADSDADISERRLLLEVAQRLQIDEMDARHLTLLAKQSFGITGQDGTSRDWTTAFAMLAQSVLHPSDGEL